MECSLYLESVEQRLRSDNRKVRGECLEDIRKKFTRTYPAEICKIVINCFNDKAELCRHKAVSLLVTGLESSNALEKDISILLVLSIHERIGGTEITETSEEIRLLLVTLLRTVISKSTDVVLNYPKEICSIVVNGVNDNFAEVKRESCECASEFAEKFHHHSDELINAMLMATKHKHFRVRAAAINGLAKVVCYTTKESIVLVCGTLGECLLDRNHQVRYAVFKTVSYWFLTLRSKFLYTPYMLPLVLTYLIEGNTETLQIWDEIGSQYVAENRDKLKEKNDLLPQHLDNYPENIRRPNVGCRTLVQDNAGKILPALVAELDDWKVEVRVKASELLVIIVLHVESYVIPFLDTLLPAMFKSCTDEETIVARNVINSAETMGYFISADVYWDLFESRMENGCTIGQYMVLASLLKHGDERKIREKTEHMLSILYEDQIDRNVDTNCQNYVLQVVERIIACSQAGVSETVKYRLYSILMSIMKSEDTRSKAVSLMDSLAELVNANLSRDYLPGLMNRLNENCASWLNFTADFNLFLVLLRDFPSELMEFAFAELVSVLETVLEANFEKEVTFLVLVALGELLESGKFDVPNHSQAIEKIITGPLKQQLVWRCGKTVEVMRATAITVVAMYLQRAIQASAHFAEQITPLVLSLCEDSYRETRLKALSAIALMVKHDLNAPFQRILPVVIGRLNDESDEVRIMVISTLKEISAQASNVKLESLKNTDVSKDLQLVLANVEDKNIKIRDGILDLLNTESFVRLVKAVVTEEMLKSIISKCPDESISVLLQKYLKINK